VDHRLSPHVAVALLFLYLTKPVRPAQLLDCLVTLVSQRSVIPAADKSSGKSERLLSKDNTIEAGSPLESIPAPAAD
jgi:hypothetical protein